MGACRCSSEFLLAYLVGEKVYFVARLNYHMAQSRVSDDKAYSFE
jgi:hypothetical protein